MRFLLAAATLAVGIFGLKEELKQGKEMSNDDKLGEGKTYDPAQIAEYEKQFKTDLDNKVEEESKGEKMTFEEVAKAFKKMFKDPTVEDLEKELKEMKMDKEAGKAEIELMKFQIKNFNVKEDEATRKQGRKLFEAAQIERLGKQMDKVKAKEDKSEEDKEEEMEFLQFQINYLKEGDVEKRKTMSRKRTIGQLEAQQQRIKDNEDMTAEEKASAEDYITYELAYTEATTDGQRQKADEKYELKQLNRERVELKNTNKASINAKYDKLLEESRSKNLEEEKDNKEAEKLIELFRKAELESLKSIPSRIKSIDMEIEYYEADTEEKRKKILEDREYEQLSEALKKLDSKDDSEMEKEIDDEFKNLMDKLDAAEEQKGIDKKKEKLLEAAEKAKELTKELKDIQVKEMEYRQKYLKTDEKDRKALEKEHNEELTTKMVDQLEKVKKELIKTDFEELDDRTAEQEADDSKLRKFKDQTIGYIDQLEKIMKLETEEEKKKAGEELLKKLMEEEVFSAFEADLNNRKE